MKKLGTTIAKIVFGAMFIIVGLDTNHESWSLTYAGVGVCIGLGLIAWGVVPIIKARREKKQEETDRILSIPLSKFGEDDNKLEELVKKYSREEIGENDKRS